MAGGTLGDGDYRAIDADQKGGRGMVLQLSVLGIGYLFLNSGVEKVAHPAHARTRLARLLPAARRYGWVAPVLAFGECALAIAVLLAAGPLGAAMGSVVLVLLTVLVAARTARAGKLADCGCGSAAGPDGAAVGRNLFLLAALAIAAAWQMAGGPPEAMPRPLATAVASAIAGFVVLPLAYFRARHFIDHRRGACPHQRSHAAVSPIATEA